jgi:hypothetical protein
MRIERKHMGAFTLPSSLVAISILWWATTSTSTFTSSGAFAQEAPTDCTEESFRVTLEAVCPLMGDTEGLKYFEDVKNPILAVEATGPESRPQHITASFGPSFPSPMDQKAKETLQLLKSVDLMAENLFPPAAGEQVTLHYGLRVPID